VPEGATYNIDPTELLSIGAIGSGKYGI